MNISEDEFRNEAMQNSVDTITHGIKSIIETGDSSQFIDEVVMDITNRDVHSYMRQIVEDQDLEYKLTKISAYTVDDFQIFWQLCERANVYNVDAPLIGEQKVYFLETADSAMILYPIKLGSNKLNIHMELMDIDTPKFLKNMWNKLNEKKSLKDIRFVAFNNQS
jgi:hypothetical protein